MKRDPAIELYPEKRAGGFTRVDGTVQFYNRVQSLLQPSSVVVDLGAGRGRSHTDDVVDYRRTLRDLRGKGRRVIGIDLDPAVLENPSVDDARLIGPGGRFPLEDASVDVIVSDATFEHVDNAEKFTAEIERVLKPGGWLCARTPNKWGYIGLGANLVPNSLHVRFLKSLQPNRKALDVFPTRYRLNTFGAFKRYFPDSKWRRMAYTWTAEPAYFGRSLMMWQVARIVFWLTPPPFGATLMVFIQKI